MSAPFRDIHPRVQALLDARGWSAFEFQRQAWRAYLEGRSGLINAPTGLGKTWAAWMGPVREALDEPATPESVEMKPTPRGRSRSAPPAEAIRVLWLTPLRALAGDTASALESPVRELNMNWSVQMRTGDTPQSVRRKQKERLPTALVTTPESLSLLLSYPDATERLATLRLVVCDEWHELMGSKRGVQVELALARLRRWFPNLRTWGVSATLGNLEQARDVLLGPSHPRERAVLIRADTPKKLEIRTLIPADIERYPWSGHLGTRLVREVIEAVSAAQSTLLFTNTRSQAELWFRRLVVEAPDLMGTLAIHHGSLDRDLRAKVESMLAAGKLKCVVCTSSLDLGVDFAPVDQVLQVGSPKGVARLMQRAGRSGHRPGAESRVLGVPTHAFELVEFAAARAAARAGRVESRPPLDRPLDVLVQHLVTIACAGGFEEWELLEEVRATNAFSTLSDKEWSWAMDFVSRGGPALTAYPHYSRIRRDESGRWIIASDRTARVHRLSIGTISSEQSMTVKYASGRTLGHIEEDFIGRLRVGNRFVFAGKILELVRVREMSAIVKPSKNRTALVPRWDGGRFSLSTQLASGVRDLLDEARLGRFDDPEMQAARPLLKLQEAGSILPDRGELLIEEIAVDDHFCAFVFPFQGRMVHEGLAALLALRLSRIRPTTITGTANDYGLGLKSEDPLTFDLAQWRAALSSEHLVDDMLECLNGSNLARRQFRDIARVAGLIVPSFPGQPKPARHLQATSEMFFDVFEEFDPGNLLLDQARREVLEAQLELRRLKEALEAIAQHTITIIRPARLTPLAFPIWAEHLRATTLSSEKWADMVAKMVVELESGGTGSQALAPARAAPGSGSRTRPGRAGAQRSSVFGAGATEPSTTSSPRRAQRGRGRLGR